MGHWLTNIENPDILASAVDTVKAELAAATDGDSIRAAKQALENAKFYHSDVTRTIDQIKAKHGNVNIGPPMATEYKTADEIASAGVVGLYKEGAGTGS